MSDAIPLRLTEAQQAAVLEFARVLASGRCATFEVECEPVLGWDATGLPTYGPSPFWELRIRSTPNEGERVDLRALLDELAVARSEEK